MPETKTIKETEPMWPSFVAFLAASAMYLVMPDKLGFIGPPWLLLSTVCILMIPGEIAHRMGHHRVCRTISFVVLLLLTFSMVRSVGLHVFAITQQSLPPGQLLISAIILWTTNILVFACWYWRLDAGGPHKRNEKEGHEEGAFLFPQMTINTSGADQNGNSYANWSPQFIDYLFLSFNTSTALSPTDVPVLSRWAKVLMMVQSAVSLTVVVLLAARAVNIL